MSVIRVVDWTWIINKFTKSQFEKKKKKQKTKVHRDEYKNKSLFTSRNTNSAPLAKHKKNPQ